jgi:Disulphide bond corrector protein DsbC
MNQRARRATLNRNAAVGVSLLALQLVSVSQDQPLASDIPSGKIAPSITMSAPTETTIPRGKAGMVQLRFHIGSGFHINSNKPKSEFLIPTVLKLDAPTDIVIGRVIYPPGQEMSFAFSPNDRLSVYTGEFPLSVSVRPLADVVAGKYMIRGQLRYQACDNAACYPPKKLPLEFEVKVAKGAPVRSRKNPAQSPHAHQ